MGMGGGGKGQGGPMSNPGFGGFQPGMGYAGGNPNFNEMQPGRIGSPGPNQTMPLQIGGPSAGGQGGPINSMGPGSSGGMAYGGGPPSSGFSERMGFNDPTLPGGSGSAAPPTNAGPAGGLNAGPAANPQVLGSILKRWDGTGQLGAQPGVPDAPPMTYSPPGAGTPTMPPPSWAGAPQGVPGMAAGNFGPPGQSGNSQDAISQAMATGNQGALQGQGSQATNSDINNQFYHQGVATPYYQANQAKLNRQGPAYQPGGMFYNKAIDG